LVEVPAPSDIIIGGKPDVGVHTSSEQIKKNISEVEILDASSSDKPKKSKVYKEKA